MDNIIAKYRPKKKQIQAQADKKVGGATAPSLKGKESIGAKGISKNDVYNFDNYGLEMIGKHLAKISGGQFDELREIRAPEKKMYVMIIGNHSAGKSSFINWYIGEKL